MTKSLLLVALAASAAFAQYRMEPAAALPEGLPAGYGAVLAAQGVRILKADGSPAAELWFRTALPPGAAHAEDAVAFPSIPHGAMLGVIRFPSAGADRRGQTIKPGLYTLRYSRYPMDGNHQGVAPQRDFLLLVPAAEDKDPNSLPDYAALTEMSCKASGTPHPAVFEMEPPPADAGFPALEQHREKDWVLNVKVGTLPLGVIVIGKSDAG
ncbi:MAG: hypothetical protein ACE15B_22695 [Bryobacteraceae bacterium]